MNRATPIRDITGKKFGNLEVLRMEQDPSRKDGMWFAICKCHVCGRMDYKAKPYWIKGKYGSHTKSCGCDKTYFKRQSGRNSCRFRGYKDMSSRYVSDIRRRAKKLKIEFDLDAKFLWELFEKQNKRCALSGDPIAFPPTNRQKPESNISLDRIDSNKGYTHENVQWVHKNVNLMKMYLDQKVFIDFCAKICHHFRSITHT
jgi:hypothetical protein